MVDLISNTSADLEAAALAYSKRTDSFAAGKAGVCLSMATNVRKYGKFASSKQHDFAMKLIQWSTQGQREQKKPLVLDGAPVVPVVDVQQRLFPKTAALFGPSRLAKLVFGDFRIALSQDGANLWLVLPGGAVAKLAANGAVVPFKRATDEQIALVIEQLKRIEADPIGEARRVGKETGTCCVCGRLLVNEGSVEDGIGPVCASRF